MMTPTKFASLACPQTLAAALEPVTDMSEMKHTAGPWQLADNDGTIVVTEALDAEGNCEIIADVLTAPGKARPCDFANARLIAAAPDLLEALKLARGAVWPSAPMGDATDRLLATVDAAIAKAETLGA